MNRSELKQKAKASLGNGLFHTNWLTALLACVVVGAITSVSALTAIGPIIVFGPLCYGLSVFFLNQARSGEPFSMRDLFTGFTDYFLDTFLLGLMISIFTCLWSMLFIIPGFVKAYAYSMAYYIKADHPDYDWRKCIAESKALTQGHKGELFVLDLSFIGWLFVGSLCFGLGLLWVSPYMTAARTQFYLALTASSAPAAESTEI